MATAEQLLVRIDATTEQLRREMAKADQSVGKFGGQVDTRLAKVERSFDRVNRQVSNALRGMGAAMLAVAGIGGLGALSSQMDKFVANTGVAQRSIRQLEAALRSTGGASGQTLRSLQDTAAALQKVTTFGDEVTQRMQGILLTFTSIADDTFPRATAVIQDVAVAMDQDLKSAAIQVGKALNDPIANLSALSRSGIQFSTSQKDVIRSLVETNRMAEAQAVILDELERQFGGSAQAARETIEGAQAALGNAFGDLFEVSNSSAERFRLSLEGIVDVASSPAVVDAFQRMGSAVLDALAMMNDALASALQSFAENFDTLVAVINAAAGALAAFAARAAITAVISATTAAIGALSSAMNALMLGALATGSAFGALRFATAGLASAVAGPLGLAVAGAAAGYLLLRDATDEVTLAQDRERQAIYLLNDELDNSISLSEDMRHEKARQAEAHIASAREALREAESLLALQSAQQALAKSASGGQLGDAIAARPDLGSQFSGVMSSVDEARLQAQQDRVNQLGADLDIARDNLRKIFDDTTASAPVDDTRPDKIQDIIDALAFQEEQLGRTAEEQFVYNQLKAAGATLESEHGQAIAETASRVFRLQEAQQASTDATRGAEQATKANTVEMQRYKDAAQDATRSLEGQVAILGVQLDQGKDAAERLEMEISLQEKLGPLYADNANALKKLLDRRAELNDQIEARDASKREEERLAEDSRREAERLAEEQSRLLQQPILNAIDGIQGAFSGMFDDVLSDGIRGFEDFGDKLKAVMARSAAEIAALLVFNPQAVTNGQLGSALGSLGGIFGSGNVASATAAGRSTGGGLGSLLGFADYSTDFVGPLQPGQTRGLFTASAFNQYLGGAAIGLGSGSLAASLSGGNQIGGGIGGLLGGLAGVPFGPVGTIIGGAAGGFLGGLFGPGKSVGGVVAGDFDVSGATTGSSTDNGASEQAAADFATGVSNFLQYFTDVTGGQFGRNFTIEQSENEGFGVRVAGQMGQKFGSDFVGAIEDAVSRAGFSAENQDILSILSRSQAKTAEGLVEDIEFARFYYGLQDLNPQLTQVEQSMAALSDQMEEAANKAADLGLETGVVYDRMRDEFNASIEDQIRNIEEPFSRALDLERRNAEARLELAREVGADITEVERLNAMIRQDIIESQTQDLENLLSELKTGSLSGLTASQSIQAANDNYSDVLNRARGGDERALAELAGAANSLVSQSVSARGFDPETASLRQSVMNDVDALLNSVPSFATGTPSTPPGLIRVHQDELLVRQPGGMEVITAANAGAMALQGDITGEVQALNRNVSVLVRILQEGEAANVEATREVAYGIQGVSRKLDGRAMTARKVA